MDLQSVVRRRPGDARAEQLGHAGLEVAALAFILLTRGEIGDLAGDMDFHRHADDFAEHARE